MVSGERGKLTRFLRAGAALAVLAGVGLASPALAQDADAFSPGDLYTFGDSLSDTGNVLGIGLLAEDVLELFGASTSDLGLPSSQDYYDGRFSNGYIWVDHVNSYIGGGRQKLNPGIVGPFWRVTSGFNFAHGGAVVNARNILDSGNLDLGNLAVATIPALQLDDQARHFRNASYFHRKGWFHWGWSKVFDASSGDYASISIGGNDYRSGVTNVNGLVSGTIDAIDDIRDRGIRQFFVLAVPDITLTPLIRGQLADGALSQAEFAALSERVDRHNTTLSNQLNNFSRDRNAEVYFVRIDRLLDDAAQNPAGYGFTNTTDACLDEGLVLSACPDSYLFYDPFHPTRAAHGYIGQLAIATMLDVKQGRVSGFARSSAIGEQALVGNQLLTSRYSAFLNGGPASGPSYLTGNLGFAVNGQHSGLGFHDSNVELADGRQLSLFRYVDGQAPGFFEYTPADEPYTRFDGRSLDFSGGEWIASYGADIQLSEAAMIGVFYSQSNKQDDLFATQRDNRVESVSVYGARQTGALMSGLSYHTQTVDQGTSRLAQSSFIGFIESDVQSRADTIRLDNAYEVSGQSLSASIVSKIAYSRHDHDGYTTRSRNQLIENTFSREINEAALAYLGADVSKTMHLGQGITAAVSLEMGAFATSSSAIGFTPLIDDTLAINPELDPVGFADPIAQLSDTAIYSSLRADLVSRDRFSVSAEVNSLSSERGSQQIARLKAGLTF